MDKDQRERWQRSSAVLDELWARPAEAREAYLEIACAGDPELQGEVEALLSAAESSTFLESPAVVFAAPLIETSDDTEEPVFAGSGLVGPYRIVRELARGGMGTVFLAERDDGQFEQRVAVKLMRRGFHADAPLVRRFFEERQLLARLDHPHIARLFDGGVTADGVPYFAMEYIAGQPIDRYCDEQRLPLEARLELFCQVCDAVQYAHLNRVVHRDLKPNNILVTADGRVKLLDFGIAKLVDPAAGATAGLTRAGERLLTPEYASPEQVRGEPVTPACDMYSLGVVLHELLTGDRPFRRDGRTPHELERAILEEEPAAPSTAIQSTATGDRPLSRTPEWISEVRRTTPERLRRRLRGDLDAIVLTAIRKQPERRYAAPEHLAADIRRYLRGQPVQARAEARGYRLERYVRRRWRRAATTLAVALVLVGAVVGTLWLRATSVPERGVFATASAAAIPRIAVLPFRHIGDPADQYFSDGLTEELSSRLASLSGLAVVSRRSSNQYRDTNKPLRQIGNELGVQYVFEGSVLWEQSTDDRSRVRVVSELTRVADGGSVWSHTFDAELTEILRVQGEIAEQVVAALDVAIADPERGALAVGPTRSSEAYDFFLRGNDYFNRGIAREDLASALELYGRAAAADPEFALVRARLARVHLALYWFGHDHTAERLARARAAVNEAFRLAPDLPEAQLALGFYYYWGFRNYRRALEHFRIAGARQPNNAELLAAMAFVERRMNRWDDAVAHLRSVLELDPRSNMHAQELGDTYFSIRDYAAAERTLDRAIALAPDWALPYVYKANLYVVWRGDLGAAHRVLREALTRMNAGTLTAAILATERTSASIATTDTALAAIIDGLTLTTFPGDTVRYYLLKAELHSTGGRPDRARAFADSARAILEARLDSRPDDAASLSSVGLAYAMLGRHADAVRAGRRAVDLLPITGDTNTGPFMVSNLARIHTLLGEPERAIELLEPLLRVPSWISGPALRADPIWTPLRSQPHFRALAALSGASG